MKIGTVLKILAIITVPGAIPAVIIYEISKRIKK